MATVHPQQSVAPQPSLTLTFCFSQFYSCPVQSQTHTDEQTHIPVATTASVHTQTVDGSSREAERFHRLSYKLDISKGQEPHTP